MRNSFFTTENLIQTLNAIAWKQSYLTEREETRWPICKPNPPGIYHCLIPQLSNT
jgi:hypothetical protein